MSRAGRDVRGVLCATGDKEMPNISGAPEDACGVSIVRSGGDNGLDTDTLSQPACHGERKPGGGIPPPHPPGRPILTGCPSQNTYQGSGARYQGAWVGLQAGPTYGFTLRTATYGIQLWSWSKVAAPTPGDLSATFLCHKIPLTVNTLPLRSADGECRGNFVVWHRRGHRRGRRGHSLPTDTPSTRSPPSITWGEFLW